MSTLSSTSEWDSGITTLLYLEIGEDQFRLGFEGRNTFRSSDLVTEVRASQQGAVL